MLQEFYQNINIRIILLIMRRFEPYKNEDFLIFLFVFRHKFVLKNF